VAFLFYYLTYPIIISAISVVFHSAVDAETSTAATTSTSSTTIKTTTTTRSLLQLFMELILRKRPIAAGYLKLY